MSNQIINIRVFIASPGDVGSERNGAKEVVAELDKEFRAHGFGIQATMWEDATYYGSGRAQEQINKNDVLTCDVFVGILWQRWGQPTGKYQSGFEEEFAITEDRLARSEAVLPLLYFKLDPVGDGRPVAGDRTQLTKVLEFKASLSSKIFYKEFRSTSEFQGQLRARLLQYVLSRLKQVPTAPASASVELGAPQEKASKVIVTTTSMSDVVQTLSDFGFDHKVPVPEQVAAFINAAGLLNWRRLKETLGAHEINLAFLHSAGIRIGEPGNHLILRTLLADTAENTAGWKTLRRKLTPARLAAQIKFSALYDGAPSVRLGASRFLGKLWNAGVRKEIISVGLKDSDKNVARLHIQNLGEYGAPTDSRKIIPFLKSDAPDDRTSAWLSLWRLNQRRGESYCSEFLQAYDPADYGVRKLEVETLRVAIHAATVAGLAKLVQGKYPLVRVLALVEQVSRGIVAAEQLDTLLPIEDNPALHLALTAMIKNGRIKSVSEIRLRLPKNAGTIITGIRDIDGMMFSLIQLLPASGSSGIDLDWGGAESPFNYFYWGLHADHGALDEIRADLRGGFKQFRDKSFLRSARISLQESPVPGFASLTPEQQEKFVEGVANKLDAGFASVHDFIRDQFVNAAFLVLAIRGKQSDCAIAHATNPGKYEDSNEGVLRLLEAFGGKDDAQLAYKLSERFYGDRKLRSLILSLKLDTTKTIARKMIASSSVDSVRLALVANSLSPKEKSAASLKYLLNENEVLRKISIAWLALNVGKSALEKILRDHIGGATYYYNTVHWFDVVLYSPKEVRATELVTLREVLTTKMGRFSIFG